MLGVLATRRCLASLYYQSYFYVLVCQLKSSYARNAIIRGILSVKQNRRYVRDANPTIGKKKYEKDVIHHEDRNTVFNITGAFEHRLIVAHQI